MTPKKLKKAKKRRRDYEKKRNIINAGKSKAGFYEMRDGSRKIKGLKVVMPRKRK